MNNVLGSIFQTLDMNTENGLANVDSQTMTTFQRYFFNQVREKIGIDAVFFLRDAEDVPKIPLIYFSTMDTYDSEKIAELHRLAWNTGEAPLLFIVLPDQLLVYNNYIPPRRNDNGKYDENEGLLEQIKLVNELEEQRKLLQYHRIKIETGEFWQKNIERFDINNRVDTTLMLNLKEVRKMLLSRVKNREESKNITDKEQVKIVHALLGRSILIKYLEERTDSNGDAVFPKGFFNLFKANATEYTDVLTDINSTYSLFQKLEERFHGDIFPLINQETKIITQGDLDELRLFLLGESDFVSQQMVLWPLYSFNIIPIQLISSIYELFFHLSEMDPNDEKGTYYTPFHLVSMLMDEVLAWDGTYTQIKILDPACGSGVFLVEAYRRLIGRWMNTNQAKSIRPNELQEILQSCIFGIDCNEESIRIASFSLSLAMCDFLEPRTIWDKLQFPRLLHYNLFPDDFFERQKTWEKKEFDIVIGNPPWESRLSPYAQMYIDETNYVIGDKKIEQAFTWRAIDVCKNGVVCFLLPSKGFLFNRSDTTSTYRKHFFETCDVSIIINYSFFNTVLFEHAKWPAIGIIYHTKKSDEHKMIFYCTPKPLYTVEDRRMFLIEPNDICRIPAELYSDDWIWKTAMCGNPRDLDLIRSIQSMHKSSMKDIIIGFDMDCAEGFKRGNRKDECKDFINMPFIEPKTFSPGENSRDSFSLVSFSNFERTVKEHRAIFKAPHLLIKQSPHRSSARFLADVLNFDAAFGHSFLGIHGDENILKYLCLIINSKIFSYYHLMTSGRWIVDPHSELEAGDILATPFPYPTKVSIEEAVTLFETALYDEDDISLADEFAYRQYRLHPHEVHLVKNTIDYSYDYFIKKGRSVALKSPAENILKEYAETLVQVLKNTLGTTLHVSCCIYYGSSPLLIAALDLTASKESIVSLKQNTGEIDTLLEKLDKQLIETRSGSVFVKRNVRIYNKDSIFIVKPNQIRYWNYSAACRDADEVYEDVMTVWREENE